MVKKLFFLVGTLLMSFLFTTAIYAQGHNHGFGGNVPHDASVTGSITEEETGQPVPGVTVQLKGTLQGSVSNVNGVYYIPKTKPGTYTLIVRSVGYKNLEKTIVIEKGQTTHADFSLKNDYINIDEVVVSANRTETIRRMAPVLVSVTDAKLFDATSSVNLDQALKFNPGIRVEDNCQNCGFNQVRINGLDGPYSQILINSKNIFSALAGVYGLEMIPTDMISRVEVIRGGGSALYGSNAIGGTINIITKAPTYNTSSFSYTSEFYKDNFKTPSHNANFYSSVVSKEYKSGIAIFGRMKQRPGLDFKRQGSVLPGGKDGFTDLPRLGSATIGTSAFLALGNTSKLSLDYFYTTENRRGGDNLDRPEHESYIAESLRHRIHSGILKFDQYLFEGKGNLSAFFAGSNTVRNSYYGGGPITPGDFADYADGKITGDDLVDKAAALAAYGLTKDVTIQSGIQYAHQFDNFLFMPAELTAGLEDTYNKLNDVSGVRDNIIDQKINTVSLFLQNEWKNDMFSILLGGRYDHLNLNSGEEERGLTKLNIFTPRATFRFNPMEDLSFRLSYAKGFRAPAYFEEELHVAFANGEGKPRVLDPDLREETSRSVTLSGDYYTSFADDWSLNLMAEGFFTRIYNKFTPVEMGDKIYLRNKDGDGKAINANVYGANMEVRVGYKNLTSLQLGLTAQNNLYDNPQSVGDDFKEEVRDFLRTPKVYGYFVWSVNPVKPLSLNLSGDFSGSMYVPHEMGDKTGDYITSPENVLVKTKPFFSLNFKAAYLFDFHNYKLELNAGVNNIFNSYQKDFDEGPTRASAYIYGPKTPLMIFAGFKVNI